VQFIYYEMKRVNTYLIVYLDVDSTYTNLSVPYSQEGYVHYVVDAVFTLVISIQKLVNEKCSNSTRTQPLCKEFFPFDGTKLLSVLRNTTFRNSKTRGNFFRIDFDYFFFLELSKRIIKFTENGDGIGTYDIFQYQRINNTNKLDYLTIGEFTDSDQNNER
jgi:hypothetical protein